MEERENIRKNIEEHVGYSGKTKTLIAKELGVEMTTIIHYTNGTSLPHIDKLRKLCRILDCSYEDILGPIK